ncbi:MULTISPECIES: glycosyltransferase family 1 protein [Nocardiaceae]|uniref:Glycosyltransferase family 1 protein n=1 Tax=Rhodococcoides kroppenstedtii TaxID=293050 RepID=A0ABS7NW23_9NOCA|nr:MULTISPECIES: glycosyltransferase family 1 protein [Rhodococcus]AMY20490.1 hypothetical protein A3Q40_03128 [Rhodococcus sp. PBTS 1]MBY6314316.1 glycosyltransferase family 1 protein [Rhodococcus kroppenstedtii]MBY6322215.1 glycosyltransferase family 1 protein [Rhodococcus kroppenstedtii]MBY6401036.1 glycosyltransferase family 1 protein [Rhodococcus kroppenstedtii]
MTPLERTRLVYVAPAAGRSGVGDYADDFLAEIRPHFGDVRDRRIDTEGAETVREVIDHCLAVRRLSTSDDRPTVVHFEQSSGSLSAFWAAASLSRRSAIVTATVHDPPHPVWWPLKTRSVGAHRLLHHTVHYPTRPVHTALQRRVTADRTLFALTNIGAQSIRDSYPRAHPVAARIYVPQRSPLPRLPERPLAVGLFGHVYGGKGFDLVTDLRRHIGPDIDIVVAGRGTEALPDVPGVRVLGEVNGRAEDAFFASVRLLLIPYRKHGAYGPSFPASSTITRAFAYRTPVVCFTEGALAETVGRGGAVGADTVIEMASVVNRVARDDERLTELADDVHRVAEADSLPRCAEGFLNSWSALLERRRGITAGLP